VSYLPTILFSSGSAEAEVAPLTAAEQTAQREATASQAELHALITRAQAGEQTAQSDLVRRYTHRVAGFVRPIVGQASAVEDVVQLVFIKMLRRLEALRDPAAFEAWLLCLARNTAVDSIRRRRCRPDTVWDEREITETPDSDSTQRVAEIMEALEVALRQLSPRDRNLVTLIVDGHSYSTAAEREGLSVGAVKLRLNRVRPFLRECVGSAVGLPAPVASGRVRPPRARLAA
jgi:RNA polymerase sigma-70 factor, ECF subfamily